MLAVVLLAQVVSVKAGANNELNSMAAGFGVKTDEVAVPAVQTPDQKRKPNVGGIVAGAAIGAIIAGSGGHVSFVPGYHPGYYPGHYPGYYPGHYPGYYPGPGIYIPAPVYHPAQPSAPRYSHTFGPMASTVAEQAGRQIEKNMEKLGVYVTARAITGTGDQSYVKITYTSKAKLKVGKYQRAGVVGMDQTVFSNKVGQIQGLGINVLYAVIVPTVVPVADGSSTVIVDYVIGTGVDQAKVIEGVITGA
jgi:hypothetical protein